MAEIKTVELHIKSNVDTASKEFDNFAKSIKAVDTSATNLDSTFEEVYGDLQPLTTRMGEAEDRLYELALAGKQGTKEFKDLLQSVGNYRKTQIQTDMVVDAAATTLGQKLTGSLNAAAGGFALVQGSMALFGTESEDVEKAILKVQSAMAISQGVETIREGAKSVQALGAAIRSTTIFQKAAAAAQYVWNAAMAANPLGALVVTISALLVGGYKLIKFFKDSSDANEKAATSTRKNTSALKEQSTVAAQSSNKLKSYNDQQYALAQAAGASNEELRKLALKHKEEEIALNKKNAVLAQSTFLRERDTLAALQNSGASDEVIANQEKLVQSTYASFKKQNELLSNSYKERAALRKANDVAEVAENKAKLDKLGEDAKTKQKEAQDKRNELIKEDRQKQEENDKEFQESFDALKISQEVKKIDQFRNEIAKNNEKNKQLVDSDAVRTNSEKILSESRIEEAQKEADAKRNINNIAIQSAQGLVGILASLGEKNKGIQRAALLANSALSIAEIINNTNVGSSKEVATKGIFGLSTSAVLYAKMGISIASVLAATSKGLKGLGSGGSAGSSMGSMSSGGSSPVSVAPVSAAPSFNVVGTSGQNQIAQSLGNQAPVKAYVVANDVSSQQSLDRNIVKTATLGN